MTLENWRSGAGGKRRRRAPLHLKSNCGTLLIDDFGRQRVSPSICSIAGSCLSKNRYDFLTTPAGRKIQVPFNQMIVFATNLEPANSSMKRSSDASLQIEIRDPTEDEFRQLCRLAAETYSIEYHAEVVDHLIETHYRSGPPFRFCHPRDLLLQVRNHCHFHERKPELTNRAIDSAVANYFVGG